MNEAYSPPERRYSSVGILGTRQHIRVIVPHILAVLFLGAIGLGVWQHAMRSEQFPTYDALTYVIKAKNFWSNPLNALDAPPASRPPGTVLMSFPFGFNHNFKAFHFRSVYIPVVVAFLAVYLCAFSWSMKVRDHWNLAMLGCFFITMPLFYHFECGNAESPTYWGLVDNFLASVAALAVACTIRSIQETSLKWLVAASFSAVLCILIKPMGLSVMMIVGLSWSFIIFFKMYFLRSHFPVSVKPMRFFLTGVGWMIFLFSAILFACFWSKYLSSDVIVFWKTAMDILKNEFNSSFTPKLVLDSIHFSLGFPFIVFAGFVIAAFIRNLWKIVQSFGVEKRFVFLAITVIGLLIAALGGWMWLGPSGFQSQIRYVFPFALMSFTCFIPLILSTAAQSQLIVNHIFRTLWGFSAAAVLLAILMSSCPQFYQRLLGVNLNSGTKVAELSQAQDFLNHTRDNKRDVQLYSLMSGATYVFDGVCGYHEEILLEDKPRLTIKRPIDWQRPSAVRIFEILESDYILFPPILDSGNKQRIINKKIDNISEEINLFCALFTDLEGGVETLSETSLRLLKITDKEKLANRLDDFLKTRDWPKSFLEAQREDAWVSLDSVPREFGNNVSHVGKVAFDGCYVFHCIEIKKYINQIEVLLWFSMAVEPPPGSWHIFLHILDKSGKIIENRSVFIATSETFGSKPIRFKSMLFRDPSVLTQARSLGFGVYRPTGDTSTFMTADQGDRDWENRRGLLGIPEATYSGNDGVAKVPQATQQSSVEPSSGGN